MGAPPLVKPDIEKGRATLEAIKRANVPVRAAAWAYLRPAEEWRLVIVSPLVDREGHRGAYAQVQRALTADNVLSLQRLVVTGPDEPLGKLVIDTLKTSGRTVEGPITVTSTSSGTGSVGAVYLTTAKG